MGRVLLAFIILTLGPGSCPLMAQAGKEIDETHSGGRWNCRGWRRSPDLIQLGYAIGLKDGYGYGAGEGKVLDGDLRYLGPTTYGEVQRGITSFCSKPENANVPVLYGAIVFCMKIRGESAASIEEYEGMVREFENTEHSNGKGKM